MVLMLWAKMLSANQIAGLCKMEYLKKEVNNEVYFWHVDKDRSFLGIVFCCDAKHSDILWGCSHVHFHFFLRTTALIFHLLSTYIRLISLNRIMLKDPLFADCYTNLAFYGKARFPVDTRTKNMQYADKRRS